MSIYINKNNQQSGPFDDAKVLEMLGSGEVSPDNLAIRHGENEWRNLGFYFPNVGNVASVAASSAPKKKGKKLLGCGGFFLVFLLVAGVLGVLAVRNLIPGQTDGDLPETVNISGSEFKLKERNRGQGDIWGTEKAFVAIYMQKDYPDDYTKAIICLLYVYADEKAAKEAFEKKLRESCRSGEKPMRFSFLDADKKELSTSATCAAPLFVLKDNKIYSIGMITSDTSKNVANTIGFAENLPFNQGSKMTANTGK